jgi:DNA-binding NarL/FixJ family response regulator
MKQRDEPAKRAVNLFQKASGLRNFRNKHKKQFETLTDRETEILILVANGLQNPSIAKKLNISRTTVQNHRTGIRKKLTINSQADYIKYAFAFGLISF